MESLYQAAQHLQPPERASFIARECGADEDLRTELESLLAQPSGDAIPGLNSSIAAVAGAVVDPSRRAGERIGPYVIVGRLGAGATGEVFRAQDVALGREVALKVLSASFAHDPERMARLRREARILASLNHPNIAQVYGFDDPENPSAIVLELVDGETLANRIARGPVPVGEALHIAVQILAGLAAAHEQGIVHRDLKPANVKVRADGTVKVLDFGIARTLPAVANGHLEDTLTAPGAVFGTLQYMSPEQIQGLPVDNRADIFALGVVLYEMVSGAGPFTGTSRATIAAAILERDPEPLPALRGLTQSTAVRLQRFVSCCLQKRCDTRWRSASDAAVELRWLQDDLRALPSDAPRVSRASRRTRMTLALAAPVVAAIAAWALKPAPEAQRTAAFLRASISPPPGQSFFGGRISFSADGSLVAFRAVRTGELSTDAQSIWIQSLRDGASWQVPHSEGAWSPTLAPDGADIAFCSDGKAVQSVHLATGSVVTLATGGCSQLIWTRDGGIALVKRGGVFTVGTGGIVQKIASDRDDLTFIGIAGQSGDHFIVIAQATDPSRTGIYLLDAVSHETRLLVAGNGGAVLASGYLLYHGQTDEVLAQPFDATRLAFTGPPRPILTAANGFGASPSGVLAWVTGTFDSEYIWRNRAGKQIGTLVPPSSIEADGARLSPDGTRVAYSGYKPGAGIWVETLATGATVHLTTGDDAYPIWAPDGRSITFQRSAHSLWRKALEPPTTETLLLTEPAGKEIMAKDWSPDGAGIVFCNGYGTLNILDPRTLATKEVLTNDVISDAKLSPDAHWLAYTSEEDGAYGVYVATFPGFENRLKVSVRGGTAPVWRSDGRELFYLAPDRYLMAVPVQMSGTRIGFGRPSPMFRTTLADPYVSDYQVTPDGTRFLIRSPKTGPAPSLQIVTSFKELRR